MRQLVGLAALAALAAVFAASAAADSVYHTQRLPLVGMGGAEGGGAVVNVHPNGPNVFAHEIYTLKAAVPGAYQVTLIVYPTSLDCTGPTIGIPTAMLTTNAVGNGEADAKFTPGDVGPLHGLTFSLRWTVSGPATYETACSVVTLD